MKTRLIVLTTLLFCIVTSLSFSVAYRVSVCSIFQNEAPYFKEWIEFHKMQGVQHFYLYNNNSSDDFQSVLQPYIDADEVTLTDWLYTYDYGAHNEWLKIQCKAYWDCLNTVGKQSEWIAFIDIDEFLFCPDGMDLYDFLIDYREFGGLCVNWLKFGTSGVEDVPENTCLIEVLTRCLPHDDSENYKVKSIVQPRYVSKVITPHIFHYKFDKKAVGVNKKPVSSLKSAVQSLDQIRINHYWTRTNRYFLSRKVPSSQQRRPNKYSDENVMKISERCNLDEDFEILKFVQPLRLRMGFVSN